jgi:hypothetical protein
LIRIGCRIVADDGRVFASDPRSRGRGEGVTVIFSEVGVSEIFGASDGEIINVGVGVLADA